MAQFFEYPDFNKHTLRKKIIILTTGALLFSSAVLFAQDTTRQQRQDTSRFGQQQQRQQEQQRQEQDQTDLRKRDQTQQDMDQDMEGWTAVNKTDTPTGLRTTLSESRYSGWENSTIYRNDRDNGYRVRIGRENPKTYYFDRDGKLVTKPDHKRDN